MDLSYYFYFNPLKDNGPNMVRSTSTILQRMLQDSQGVSDDFGSYTLTRSRGRPLSYRNHSIDLRSKSMDWFLYITASVLKGLKD